VVVVGNEIVGRYDGDITNRNTGLATCGGQGLQRGGGKVLWGPLARILVLDSRRLTRGAWRESLLVARGVWSSRLMEIVNTQDEYELLVQDLEDLQALGPLCSNVLKGGAAQSAGRAR